MSKKLLIIGSNSIHTYNYIKLIEDYFEDILLLTNTKNEEYNSKTIELNYKLGFNIWSSVRKINSIVTEYNPTMIHILQANSYAFISLLATRKSRIPKVLTALGSDILINPKRNIFLRKMLEFSLKQVNIATSDSLYMASEMKRYSGQIDTRIVNFGIDIGEGAEEKENIIYSNRLHTSLYNIEKSIHAFYRFNKKYKNWKLIIAAVGNNTNILKQLVSDLGIDVKVEFIGWVDASINFEMYQKAKIYISIPSSDATSISLLEAISHNCICVVSNLPANCEHILDGINGFIETDLDKIDLSKYECIDHNILKSVNNIRKKTYFKQYNKEKFIDIYDELLGRDN